MKKQDPAHLETDKILEIIEKRISKEYKQAEKEVQAKLDDYLRRFEIKDQKWREWVKDGVKTKDEYKQWRVGQMAIGKRWEEMRDTIAQDYLNADKIAKSIVNGYKPEVYAINHDYATFEVEKGSMLDTSYTLYDKQTAENLFKDKNIIPKAGKNLEQRIVEGKAMRWNNQQIQSVMLQGIIQGESISKIATRLAKEVGEKDRKVSIRDARTVMTGVENRGRMDGYERANKMGIETKKQWLATLDDRTRHWHRELDGVAVDNDEPFHNEYGDIMFPGDPSADPANIYNCRCTLIASIKGFERDLSDTSLRRNEKLGDMTYEEWKAEKKSRSNPITLPDEKAKAIKGAYINEYRNGQKKK